MAVGADGLAISAVSPRRDSTSPCGDCRTRSVTSPPTLGQTVVIDIAGASGGQWTLSREGPRWILWRGEPPTATTRIRLDADACWKLLFNALPETDAIRVVQVEGRQELAGAFFRARSVIV